MFNLPDLRPLVWLAYESRYQARPPHPLQGGMMQRWHVSSGDEVWSDDTGEYIRFDDHRASMDDILNEAVWAMGRVLIYESAQRTYWDRGITDRANAFLDSQAVQDYLARQGKEKHMLSAELINALAKALGLDKLPGYLPAMPGEYIEPHIRRLIELAERQQKGLFT